jgi:von Hippel-Lindau disease tumor supressor
MLPILLALSLAATKPSANANADIEPALRAQSVKSVASELATELTFVNRSSSVRKIYWLDFDGKRVLYSTLKPGEEVAQETFLTHPWLVTDGKNQPLNIYFADALPRRIVIH